MRDEKRNEERDEGRVCKPSLASPLASPASPASPPVSPLASSTAAVRGRLVHDANLSRRVWLKCGGAAELLFEPADEADLLSFVQAHVLTQDRCQDRCQNRYQDRSQDGDVRYRALGAGSNVLVADEGVDGVVVATSRLSHLSMHEDGTIEAGAGASLGMLARFAGSKARSGLAFFVSIPGTVGGAVRMNAGAEGSETKQVLVEARVLDTRTNPVVQTPVVQTLACKDLAFRYRGSNIEEGMIVVSARFRTHAGDKAAIAELMSTLKEKRQRTQPIREKTGGSTFKNPCGHKAWQLIDQAGMRGARYGGAVVSKKHCNFLINAGKARASDFAALGERVRAAVLATSGVRLEWEIVKMGSEATLGKATLDKATLDKATNDA